MSQDGGGFVCRFVDVLPEAQGLPILEGSPVVPVGDTDSESSRNHQNKFDAAGLEAGGLGASEPPVRAGFETLATFLAALCFASRSALSSSIFFAAASASASSLTLAAAAASAFAFSMNAFASASVITTNAEALMNCSRARCLASVDLTPIALPSSAVIPISAAEFPALATSTSTFSAPTSASALACVLAFIICLFFATLLRGTDSAWATASTPASSPAASAATSSAFASVSFTFFARTSASASCFCSVLLSASSERC
ncbi:hypothetical protein BC834DRAFT_892205, partial [Gloeopeniophorella convolvens]